MEKTYTINTTEIIKSSWTVEAEDKIKARKILFEGETMPDNSIVSSVHVDLIEEVEVEVEVEEEEE